MVTDGIGHTSRVVIESDFYPEIQIQNRRIGEKQPPFVVAEIGINHEGNIDKAIQMVDDARDSGCECVKFQCHIIDDEMIPNKIVPGNADESIWEIISRCVLSEDEDKKIKNYVEKNNLLYLSTPFSRAAVDRLNEMGVCAFKIGSGECNNYPLISYISKFKRPIILSTGMNDLAAIRVAVDIFNSNAVPYALLHCTSMYPTPYDKVRLGALNEMRAEFTNAVLGLSDHSIGNYTCFGAVALGCGAILEKHFTSNRTWSGPDIEISITPLELRELIIGSSAIHSALEGSKTILPDEQPTIDFAYACVVSISDIKKGEELTPNNIWVKRPGTGQIKARDYEAILGAISKNDIPHNTQISWEMLDD